MFEPIIEAINTQDYPTAYQLLAQCKQQEPDNLWVPFYEASLEEAQGNLSTANEHYRQLLPQVVNAKLMAQIRQGIQRIAKLEETQRKNALSLVMEEAGSLEMGMLVLEAIPNELKQMAAQNFGKIMEIDAYTARLQLPSRSWRLYRTGAIGKLRFYEQQLNQGQIPCFTALTRDISALKVHQVLYIESVEPKITVVYQPKKGQRDIFTFDCSEVGQRVEGLLPLFEECVDVGLRGKLERKTKTSDYAKFCDLHLPQHKMIIRLCDQTYRFLEGVAFSEVQKATDGRATARDSWHHILQFIKEKTPDIPVRAEFTPFGESAIDFQELLKLINPRIDLLRREDTPWDAAFHLYSGLAFLKTF
ncbi:tetratricopeptide repeat protein [Crocosphaera sp. XPORK-15E]|uniref:tetratricopeptide repeat protein n=1 Tax=Crocosphaera sp. XPORK-15E TaxID=3110247 RepID=UPI002B1F2191|nr:tetratricopeptide repeat protein [Crocosphaera sp. XPORK-15E]MEA5533480.1 tetratricopeptide repeat protein [Crocosphaera sp. XPORK-15E]